MSHVIEHLHAQVGTFNGTLYFTLNNKLLILSVSTPNFNDYGEWRIGDMTLATGDYDPSGNDVELNPFSIPPIAISDKELSFMEGYFTDSDEFYEQYQKENNDNVSPFSYLDGQILTSGFMEGDSNLTHFIHKENGVEENGACNTELDKEVHANAWIDKKDITVYQGVYNLLIPIMEGFVTSYLEKAKSE